jgi:NAD(P)-dependent dehydrogenase (short-subunit alcohol dehydrogenase family)
VVEKGLPAAVSSTPRTLRDSSSAPTSYSRSRICRLSEGWEVWSRCSAAVVRLPSSTTATKYLFQGFNTEAEGQALEAELRRLDADAAFIQADVRRDDEVSDLVDRTVARFGRLDVAVNNAGTEGQGVPMTDQTAESYAATFDPNVLGVILSMKHEVRVMQEQGSGSIINISSTYGHEGTAGASVYVGSKHAVEGITKSVALEVAKSGIRVNSVAPGPTDTGMLTRFTGTPENKAALVTTVPMARLGLSEELANAIVFVASDEASFITGHVLNVDGGKSH